MPAMRINHLHDWNLKPIQAVELQRRLAADVITNQLLDLARVRYVAGVDVSAKGDISRAAVVVLTFPGLHLVETVTASQPTPFPYIPGLLSFREGPVLEQAFASLQTEPDALLFDGMGIMHPRRMGIAAHMGLWLDKPTVGCGKSHLVGAYALPGSERGATSPVWHNGQQIGVVLRTRARVKPVYISAGHRIDLESAIALTMACLTHYRLPEPIRQAHKAAGLASAD
jgi:deoxyribonuclease V